MLGYSLVHNHTANLAAIIHNPALHHTFTSHWDDHTGGYLVTASACCRISRATR